jgi:hypothetical protein
MPELHDLMDGVANDMAAVRWPPAEELRHRVRRRRQRAVAAAVALVTALTAGAASLARPDRDPPPPPATTPTADASPVEIPRSALLRPEDAGAGPDTQEEEPDAFQPIRFEIMLQLCFEKRAPEMLALHPRYSQRQTLLLGTEADRPANPYVVGQGVYRLTAPAAATFVRDLRAAIEGCDGFTQTGEVERGGVTIRESGRHDWSIASTGFAGDESILVRHDSVVRNLDTNEDLGGSFDIAAYVRVDDLVTVLSPRAGTDAGELRRIAVTAANRLCTATAAGC